MDTPIRRRARAAIAAVGASLMMLALLPATSFAQEAPDDAPPVCDTPVGKNALSGSTISNGEATLVNNLKGDECIIVVLTSYELPGGEKLPYAEQRLFDTTQPVVITSDTAGADLMLSVGLPSCNYQIDLYAFGEVLGDNEQGAPHHNEKQAFPERANILMDWEVNDSNGGECGPPTPTASAVCFQDRGLIRFQIERYTLDEDLVIDIVDGSGQSTFGNLEVISTDPAPRAPVTLDRSYSVPPSGQGFEGPFTITATIGDGSPFFSETLDVEAECFDPPTSTPIPTPEPIGARASSAAVCDVDGDAVVRYQITLEDSTQVDVSITDAADTVVFTNTATTSGLYVADLDDALLGTTVTVTLTPDVGDAITTDVLIDDTDCATDVTEVLGEEVDADPEPDPEPEPVTEVEDDVVVNPQVDEEPEELAQTGLGALQLLILGAGAALTGASGLVATRKRD